MRVLENRNPWGLLRAFEQNETKNDTKETKGNRIVTYNISLGHLRVYGNVMGVCLCCVVLCSCFCVCVRLCVRMQ